MSRKRSGKVIYQGKPIYFDDANEAELMRDLIAGTVTSGDSDRTAAGATTGYEFTGGFEERSTGQSGADDLGSNVQYTNAQADAGIWKRFGFDRDAQIANDVAYFPVPAEGFDQKKGLFGGIHMPSGVTKLIDFDYDDGGAATGSFTDSTESNLSGLLYTEAPGSYNIRECAVGDLIKVRFSFNAIPQIANSTLEVGLIWMTRDASDIPTFTFPLTTQPIYFGTGTQGQVFLNRVEMSAYVASDEDLNARFLPAIRCNNEILIQPLTTLISVIR